MANPLRLNKPVIAITGSAGKSTTKEMVASILSTRWQILKSIDNLNFYNHTQQYRAKVRPKHRALVLEYGMSGAGHIKRHCQIIEPNYSIITNIGSAHLGAFGGDVRKLARAKSEIIRWMKPTGTVILNNDDANTKLIQTGRFRGRRITVGIQNKAQYRAQNVLYSSGGMTFDVKLHGKLEHFRIPIMGRHHVYNALCAIAVTDVLGFGAQKMRTGLLRYRRMRRRTTIYRLRRNIFLIDDSYSSNPDAAKAAIDTLMQVGRGKKVAVLGSMQALGKYTAAGHSAVGRYVAKRKVAQLYTYGALAKRIGTTAVKAGYPKNRVVHFVDQAALHRRLFKDLQNNTTVLVKASHGLRLMDTADLLRRRLAAKGATKSLTKRAKQRRRRRAKKRAKKP